MEEDEEEEEDRREVQFSLEGDIASEPVTYREEDVPEFPPMVQFRTSPDLEVYGTTPPKSERQMKQERRANKHKRQSPGSTHNTIREDEETPPLYKSYSAADMSLEPTFLTIQSQPRRMTVPQVPAWNPVGRPGRRKGCGRHRSPVGEEGDCVRGNKKKIQRAREKNRNEKASMINDISVSSPLHMPQAYSGVEEEKVEEDEDPEEEWRNMSHGEGEDEVDFPAPQGSSVEEPSTGSHGKVQLGPFHSEGPMPYHSLTSQVLTQASSHVKLQRSQSDAQFSLPSLGQAMVCPPERKKFYRSFMRTVKLYSQPQHHIRSTSSSTTKGLTGTHIPRQHSEDLQSDSPYDADMDSIWLELRAYLANRDVMMQHRHDYDHRSEVDRVLDNITKYRFTTMDVHFSGMTGDRDEYEPILSEDPTPQCSLTVKDVQLQNNEEDSDEGDEGREHQEEGGGPDTLKQQGSYDSDSSRESLQNPFPIESFLTSEQQAALSDIKKMLKELEKAELLFPSLKKMAIEFSICQTVQFKRRRDALILWSKVIENIAHHLSRLSKWFGVMIYSVYTRPTSHDSFSSPQFRVPVQGHTGSLDKRRTFLEQVSVASAATTSSSSIDPEQSLVRMASYFQTQSSATSSHTYYSSQLTSSLDETNIRGYRKFVDRTLKKKGLDWLMKQLEKFITPALEIAEVAMNSHHRRGTITDEDKGNQRMESTPLMEKYRGPPPVYRMSSTAPQSWVDEFSDMNLPSFSQLYLQLARVPLEVMQECMRLQLELRKAKKPSIFSVRQLVQDCRLTLKKAIKARSEYRRKVAIVTAENPAGIDLMDQEIATYEDDLKQMLQLYFGYVQSLVELAGGHRNLLEEEWTHTKEICQAVTGGEADAGLRFCYMACQLLEGIEDQLKSKIDSCCTRLHSRDSEDPEEIRKQFQDVCWDFKQLTEETRERCAKGLGFAKMLRKDLEIAAEFSIRIDSQKLMEALQSSEHVQVMIPQQNACMMFVPRRISDNHHEILCLLRESFGHNVSDSSRDWEESYLLVVGRSVCDSLPKWMGETLHLNPPAETILGVSEMQMDGIKMIVTDSDSLPHNRTSFIRAMGGLVEQTNERTTSLQSVAERITDLKQSLCRLAHTMMEIVKTVEEHLLMEDVEKLDLGEVYCNTMNNCYKLAFDYVRNVSQLLGEELTQQKLGEEMLNFSQQWMMFVINKCRRGHGVSPRWAQKGLDFLSLSCAPRMLASISHVRFDNLRQLMEQCIEHVIGDASTPSSRRNSGYTPSTPEVWQRPSWRARRPYHAMSVQASQFPSHMEEVEEEDVPQFVADDPPPFFVGSDSSGMGSEGSPKDFSLPPTRMRAVPTNLFRSDQVYNNEDYSLYKYGQESETDGEQLQEVVVEEEEEEEEEGKKIRQIRQEIRKFNEEHEMKLRAKKVIGKVTTREATSLNEMAKLSHVRQTHFNWRRGRKLGEGQFGKVYECINLNKGEVNAVKVISLQERPHNLVQDILSEVSAYQKIKHKNIVKLYGVEIQHNELHLFMEYCNEGTLSSAAKNGLHPQVIRRYTRDILLAVDHFHDKGIVHRDIKGGNIFLSSDSVKLGDFGLSVQLKNMTKTQPNEVKKQRGTIPYMAPEVVRQDKMGRPLDIWSVGCVVVEMITGKYPWIDYDNQYTILLLLGQGKHPPYPDDIGDEAEEFLQSCFVPEPNNRPTASFLLDHSFVKVMDDDEPL